MAYQSPYMSPYVQQYSGQYTGQYTPQIPAYQPVYSPSAMPQNQASQVQPQTQLPQGQTAQNQQTMVVPGINWVTEAQASAFVPTTGVPIALWVQEAKRIYLKSLDNMGKPATVVLEYREIDANAPVAASSAQTSTDTAYALKSELDALREEIAPVLALVKQDQKPKRLKEETDGE